MGKNDRFQFFKQLSGKSGSNIYAGFQGQTNPQNLAFFRQLQREMKKNNCLETALSELEVIVFDIETTGFYPEKGDKMISIGAVKMTGPTIHYDETFYSLIKSTVSLSNHLSALTGIYDEQLQKAPDAADVLRCFLTFTGNKSLIAHHSKHEQAFMQKTAWDSLKLRFDYRIIDTSFLIRLKDQSAKSLPLEEVCAQCGIEIKNRHHALGDAVMTAQIWAYYLKQAQSLGFKNLQEVYEFLAKLG
jgi:DNA polymerase-3 subunit epsilon